MTAIKQQTLTQVIKFVSTYQTVTNLMSENQLNRILQS